ncbi:hypothetical protein [Pseudonocardia parietis]|uniref:Peptidase C39-like protein n=1 Tax=Pseudonocardia parietis TaxID=570936 RepID=A0ABS4VS71_9PSEU|nr:hypothetical protein [Pseudonocardia parietis]MBP2366626.1 hypothetical protein [Pseudonocardia parietis]
MDGGPRVGEKLGRQVDGVSCGPAVLVVTAALTGSGRSGPATARSGAARSTGGTSLGAAQHLAHRQANRLWPRALGTTPWGMRAWLHRHAPAAGGFRIRPATAGVLAVVPSAPVPVPLLIGSRWLPRHWVLVTGLADDGRWQVYEPGAGVVRAFDPRTFDDGTAAAVLGRPRPWCVLLPSG